LAGVATARCKKPALTVMNGDSSFCCAAGATAPLESRTTRSTAESRNKLRLHAATRASRAAGTEKVSTSKCEKMGLW
jgi:hypothetical protein